MWDHSARINKKKISILLNIILLLIIVWPLNFFKWYHLQLERSTNIGLIQGNISQQIKWNKQEINNILNIYLEDTSKILNTTQIIIWPEFAIPDTEINQKYFLYLLDQKLQKHGNNLVTGIIGTNQTSNGYDYYNSIIVLGNTKAYECCTKNKYNKNHLVPFGEKNYFIILHNLILPNNLSIPVLKKGAYLQPPLIVSNIKLTANICYETVIGEQFRDNFQKDTDFLLTISDNSWFGNSIEPWQHFQMLRMRALELGRPLLHCANNGITAVIKADGTVQKIIPQSTRKILKTSVVPAYGTTPYVKMGSYPFWITISILGLITYILNTQKKH